MIVNQPAASAQLTILKLAPSPALVAAREGRLIRDDINGHYWKSREHLLPQFRHQSTRQTQFMEWLREQFKTRLGRERYFKLVLGHDLHISTWAELEAVQFHASERDPFTGELGWLEQKGLVSNKKVTTAFRDFEVASLAGGSDPTLYNEFKYHEVGTSSTAEANSQTALSTSTGIARVAGSQTDSGGGVYTSVATITADSTETWQEHGLFNASSSGTMCDRSVMTGSPPSVPVVNLDTVQFTWALTKNAEA